MMERQAEPRYRRKIRRALRTFSSRALILVYHRIAPRDVDPWRLCVDPENFASHLDVLHRRAHPLGLRQLAQAHLGGKIPNKAVVITFDDGYANNLVNAGPLLERYAYPATVFVTGAYVQTGREYWWDELDRALLRPVTLPSGLQLSVNDTCIQWELGAASCYSEAEYASDSTNEGKRSPRLKFYYTVWERLRPLPESLRQKALEEIGSWAGVPRELRPTHRPMNALEVQKLSRNGLVEIGSHTMNHEKLSAHPVDVQKDQILQSKIYLESLTGRAVTSFSYPFGEYTEDTVSLVRSAGFSSACTSREDVVWSGTNLLELPRVVVTDCDGGEFEHRLKEWLRG